MEEYLKRFITKYGYNEPIFTYELRDDLDMPRTWYVRVVKELLDSGSLKRVENGTYFLPNEETSQDHPHLGIEKLIRRKYLEGKDGIIGYRSGSYLATQLGFAQQESLPVIVTNNLGTKRIEFKWYGEKAVIRKSKTEVTNRNAKLLQVLDLLDNFDELSSVSLDEAKGKVLGYIDEMDYLKAEVLVSLKYYKGTARENAEWIGLL